MSNETPPDGAQEAGHIEPRDGGAAGVRKRPAYLSKLMWPLVLVVGAVMLYTVLSPDTTPKPASVNPDAAEDRARPAPRAPSRSREIKFPVFTPTLAINASPSQAISPLPPGSAARLPANPPSVAASGSAATRDSVAPREATVDDERRKRRAAPLMISASDIVSSKVSSTEPPASPLRGSSGDSSTAPLPLAGASAASQPHSFLGQATDSDKRYAPAAVRPAIKAPDLQLFEGKMISAILETPIHTDLPGYVRAMVDADVYAESGRQIVIPRMSRLVGEYDSSVRQGQTRVMVIWRRVILPDGNSLQIASYGTDSLGRAGMSGDVDNHFLQRYGAALVISAMGIAVAGQPSTGGNSTTVIPGGGIIVQTDPSNALAKAEALKTLQTTVGGMLNQQANIRPTIQIPQGSAVKVFVSRDLDFSEGAVIARR